MDAATARMFFLDISFSLLSFVRFTKALYRAPGGLSIQGFRTLCKGFVMLHFFPGHQKGGDGRHHRHRQNHPNGAGNAPQQLNSNGVLVHKLQIGHVIRVDDDEGVDGAPLKKNTIELYFIWKKM